MLWIGPKINIFCLWFKIYHKSPFSTVSIILAAVKTKHLNLRHPDRELTLIKEDVNRTYTKTDVIFTLTKFSFFWQDSVRASRIYQQVVALTNVWFFPFTKTRTSYFCEIGPKRSFLQHSDQEYTSNIL